MTKQAAVIKDGVVVNVALADPDFAEKQGWIVSDTAKIGDIWGGENFISPPAPAPDPEAQWAAIRADRNQRLADCDWTQLDDTPLTNTAKQEWASYRQALRDITLQTDPFNIVWPEAPAA